MDKIYTVTVFDGETPVIVFSATLAKARLRSLIHRAQGLRTTRPAYCPKFSQRIADFRQRGGIVSPSLRND